MAASDYLNGVTDNHKAYYQALDSKYSKKMFKTVIGCGAAGTGKTFLPCKFAADRLLSDKKHKVVIFRPKEGPGKEDGYYPGDMIDKNLPWVINVIQEICDGTSLNPEMLIKDGRIEIVPINLSRGRSFDNATMILDEAQNCQLSELVCIATRQGQGSRLVVTGDTKQTDISGGGFSEFINCCENNMKDCVSIVRFTSKDNMRSGISKRFTEEFLR